MIEADTNHSGEARTSRHGLPAQPTSLIGREREIEAVRDLLLRDSVRLLTLTGPGGIGKTRLALAVAESWGKASRMGCILWGWHPSAILELVVPAIAQALGIQESAGGTLAEGLEAYLRDRETLLLLDNFEQVIEAAPEVARILLGSPRVRRW